jgi:hypothetical protein
LLSSASLACPWQRSWTTSDSNGEKRKFTITHEFHPLFGRQFELAEYRLNWGEHRVYYFDEQGELALIPAQWTDVVPLDLFVSLSGGRSTLRTKELLQLVQLLV